MNGIEKITARIAAEAQAEAAKVISAAQEQAGLIRAEHENKAQNEYDALVSSAADSARQQTQRQGSSAQLEARKSLLALKQELIAAAYDRAQEKILSLPEDDYIRFLAKLAGQAAVSGDEEIVLNESDRARIGEKLTAAANAKLKERGLEGRLTLSCQTRSIAGGLILHKGSVDINCGLDSLLDMSRSSLDAEIAALLFA
ncbi:MAG: hypothetical protein IJ364_06625 [Oscillospiraceae bacterium]|nr:hypothetical protein [Oscillospiraceae bacterium]